MELFFIRHGQSENNALWDRSGSDRGRNDDPILTEIGQKQARYLANFMKTGTPGGGSGIHTEDIPGFGITHIYSSLMVRAVRTGMVVAEALNLKLMGWECLHECGGIYLDNDSGEPIGLPGKNLAFFRENFPLLDLPERMNPEGWWNRPFEWEDLRLARAKSFIGELLEKHGNTPDRVAVVSHGGFYNEVMTALLNLERRNGVWFYLNNTGFTRIRFEKKQTVVVYTNRVDHLPQSIIT